MFSKDCKSLAIAALNPSKRWIENKLRRLKNRRHKKKDVNEKSNPNDEWCEEEFRKEIERIDAKLNELVEERE
ncbi:MAG: hypothetical protein MHMPM18_002776 [Marteilia pararefringens]